MIAKNPGKLSARTVLSGTVAAVQEDAVDSEVPWSSVGGKLIAMITKESDKSLGLGSQV
jgi:molybdopterin-binding protein